MRGFSGLLLREQVCLLGKQCFVWVSSAARRRRRVALPRIWADNSCDSWNCSCVNTSHPARLCHNTRQEN